MEKMDREDIVELVGEQSKQIEENLDKKVCEEIGMRNINNMEVINNYMKEQKEMISEQFEKKFEEIEVKCDEGR